MSGMRGVRWWGVVSSAAAPVLLIGGWTVAAARQSGGFDPVVETISALAARDADDRWVMSAALAAVGVCHLTTAAALRPAARPGRVLFGAGGAATVLVAAFPLPVGDGGSAPHTAAAAVAFGALAAWPAVAWRRVLRPGSDRPAVPAADVVPAADGPVPVALRPAVSGAAAAGLLGLVAWFAVEIGTGGRQVGLTERLAAGAQAVWPLVAVLSARRGRT